MTVASEVCRQTYVGTGVPGGYGVSFAVYVETDLRVSLIEILTGIETLLVLGADYTVILGVAGAATVVPDIAVPVTHNLLLLRNTLLKQPVDYVENDKFPAEAHERQMDNLTFMAQRSRDIAEHSVRAPDGDFPIQAMPNFSQRAGKYLAFDANGRPIALPGTIALVVSDVSPYNATANFATAARFISDYFADVQTVKNFGAVGNNVADDTIPITNALNTVSAFNQGILYFQPGTYRKSTMTTIPNNIKVRGGGRGTTTLKWIGGINGTVVRFPQTTRNASLEDMTIDVGANTGMTGVHLRDTRSNYVGRVTCNATVNSGVAFRVEAGNGGFGATWNNAFNTLQDIASSFWNIGLQYDGVTNGITPTVTTNNIVQFGYFDQCLIGVRLAQWCDSNSFYRIHVNLTQNNTIGVVFNDSATPALDVGVYNNNFYDLSVDAFGGLAGCSGVYFNVSKQNAIHGFFHSPQVFPGSLVNDNLGRADSFIITNHQVNGLNNHIEPISKGLHRASILRTDAAGTVYGVGPTDVAMGTNLFDTTLSHNGVTFTAPHTGATNSAVRYALTLRLHHTIGITAGSQWTIKCLTTARAYNMSYVAPTPAAVGGFCFHLMADMRPGETAKFTIERSAGAGNFTTPADGTLNDIQIEQLSP